MTESGCRRGRKLHRRHDKELHRILLHRRERTKTNDSVNMMMKDEGRCHGVRLIDLVTEKGEDDIKEMERKERKF